MHAAFASAALMLLTLAPASAQPAVQRAGEWRAWAETASKSRFAPEAGKILLDSPLSAWAAVRDARIKVEPIRYASDGLQVTGFIVRPAAADRPRPVLIWARGGIGDVEQDEAQFAQMASWVERGYIVVGSNYRGSAGSEGSDEFAGRDVEDLVNLLPVIRAIPGADANRLFGIGFSRGGTMLLRTAAGRIPFTAIATAGAVTDLQRAVQERADLGETFARMMPDHAVEKANRFCIRSAVCWPERIAAPVLIAHGGADQVVSTAHATTLVDGLEKARKPYQLLIVGGADHGLNGSRQQFFDAADRFFKANSNAT